VDDHWAAFPWVLTAARRT